MKTYYKLSNVLLGITFTSLFLLTSCSSGKYITLSSTPSDAQVYLGNSVVGSTPAKVAIKKDDVAEVTIKKDGFIAEKRKYSYDNLPKKDMVSMREDDAWQASSGAVVANTDIEIQTTRSEEEAWKIISQIITSKFDVLEVADRNTGYMRTTWMVKKFKEGVIRTRVLVKFGASTSPISYKVKIVSERAKPDTSPKNDEEFSEWDRVLKVYADVVPELQSRLKK